jgi:ATP-binding cassette, subfamily C, bacterial
MIAFARSFADAVPVQRQLLASFLVLLASLTEGIGVALLAPLLALLAEDGQSGWIGAAVARAFAAVGLAPSLPTLLALFVVLVACRAALVRARDVELSDLRLGFVGALRRRLFDATARADWSFVAGERLSHLGKALSGDVDSVGHGTYFFLLLPALILTSAVQLAVAATLAPKLTAGVLACGIVIAVAVRWLRGDLYGAARRIAQDHGALFDQISDFLHALKLAKSHQAEAHHRALFGATLQRQQARQRELGRSMADARALMQISGVVALGALVYLGAAAALPLPELLLIVAIFARVIPLLTQVQQGMDQVRQMLPVFDGLDVLIGRCEAHAAPEAANTGERIALADELRLAGIRFRYDKARGPDVLAGLDLGVAAGSIVAIMGPSGAGKTTLADLITGIQLPDAGVILVDGAPLQEARLAAWRRSIAYVPQENFLFNDTVRANLLWACPQASDDELRRVLTLTGADQLVAALPNGLDTIVGERGSRLCGGERQRLALARALLRRPTLLILDEATNALDVDSEHNLGLAIERLRDSLTIVIITHRESFAQHADRIVVLDEGRIVTPEPQDGRGRRGGLTVVGAKHR